MPGFVRTLFALVFALPLITALTSPAVLTAAENVAVKPLYNTQEMTIPLSSAVESAKRFKVPEGFKVSVFAAEPDVRQPISLTTDERGRLWVAENYTYAETKVNFATDQRDRVICLEDRDQDGKFDARHVFWDKGQKLTSVEVGFGGVWVLCAPQLLFIPDRDGDLVPDGEPEVVLDGWNDGPVRHNIVNGLKWGPDGWLYGRHGIQATSLVGAPGSTAAQRTPLNCCIWRYHPTRKTFEVVAQGGTNSWGFDYDDHGQMFFINTVIGHLWHVVPGAYSERMYGVHLNPYAYDLIQQTADHFHWDTGEKWADVKKGMSDSTDRAGGGHAHCGLMIYLGDNWPDRYRGLVYTINLHGLRVNCDRLARRGCGYVATHEPDFMSTDDTWFRGLELIYGPDGGVYVADWSDIGECHENDGVHRSSGRIYKITYGTPKRPEDGDLSKASLAQLVALQSHKNDWYVRQSRRLLQERAATGTDMTTANAALRSMFEAEQSAPRRLRAMWSLYATGGLTTDELIRMLSDRDEQIRVWAVRLLVDGPQVSPSAIQALTAQADKESSGLVRVFLASAMQRLPQDARWPIAESLARHGEDKIDAELPFMLWYGIEPAVTQNPSRAVSLADKTQIPQLRRNIARRLTSELDDSPAAVDQLVTLLQGSDRSEDYQLSTLSGMHVALAGWRQAPAPPSWKAVAAKLSQSASPDVRRLTDELSVVFGDGRAMNHLQKLITEREADPAARRNALHVLVDARSPSVASLLLKLLDDKVLMNEAIRGLAFYDQPGTADQLIQRYQRFDPQGREQALNTLAARSAYARTLMAAIADGRIPARDLSASQARQLISLGNSEIDSALKKHWGEVRRTPEEKSRQMAELKPLFAPAILQQANRTQGRAIFQQKCANCHILFGQGAKIGPDLTGGNRTNLDYLLENLIDPSALVAVNFRTSVVELKDGRVVTGVVLETSARTVSVQTATELVSIARSDVEQIVPQSLSLMPEGLLTGLTPEQVRNLMAYLTSRVQVPLP
jgi:putative membrane-bound dehydrogenase-like protein